jgi:hypothetical protein
MLIKKVVILLVMVLTCILLLKADDLYSQDYINPINIDYQPIEVTSLTRYSENRVAFQHIEHPGSTSFKQDNSKTSLLIIQNNQVYLFCDGYDDAKKIQLEGLAREWQREFPKDLWINKINSKPDYIRISEGRLQKLLNVNEDYVEKNFGNFYRNVRNSIIHKHVTAFRNLMKDKRESEMQVVRTSIARHAMSDTKDPVKIASSVKAKAADGTIYYAEDCDGDEITETFFVNYDDGFNWGNKSGPNSLLIYRNSQDDIRQIMGKLCYEAYYGTTDEEELILKNFPKENEIIEAFKLNKVTLQESQTKKSESGTGKK